MLFFVGGVVHVFIVSVICSFMMLDVLKGAHGSICTESDFCVTYRNQKSSNFHDFWAQVEIFSGIFNSHRCG